MKHLEDIQRAVDFIEENLLSDISYKDAAQHLFMSGYHFHRLFSLTAGISASEYIRKRRLSLAGQELVSSGTKIIDLALKYGYETPESFSKAFAVFHGCSPTAARRGEGALQLFNRLRISERIEGGLSMEYRIVEQKEFDVLAKVKSFRNEITADRENHDIPDFWDECIESGVIDELRKHSQQRDLFGVCSPVSADSDCFDYGIGVRFEGGAVPEGMRVVRIKPTRWAVFRCIGTDSACISETWDQVFKEFLPNSGYRMLDDVDFELYPDGDSSGLFCEIWIPIEKV